MRLNLSRWRWPLMLRKTHDQDMATLRKSHAEVALRVEADHRKAADAARISHHAAMQRKEAEFRERERVAQEVVGRFAAVRVTFDRGAYQIGMRFSPQILCYGDRHDQNYVVDMMLRNIERELKSSVFVRPPEMIGDARGWRNDADREGFGARSKPTT